MTGPANETQSDVYTVRHGPEDDEPLSTAVVMAVAEAAGIEVNEIEELLYAVVDPDALDEILHSNRGSTADCVVSFTLEGHRVTVSADGTISVRSGTPPDAATEG